MPNLSQIVSLGKRDKRRHVYPVFRQRPGMAAWLGSSGLAIQPRPGHPPVVPEKVSGPDFRPGGFISPIATRPFFLPVPKAFAPGLATSAF
jgi:hypothetical protein